MIIWSGWGFVVALILLLALILSVSILPDNEWTFVVTALIAAAANFGFVILLDRRQERVMVDPRTNQQVILSRGDSLFFIPVRYWTWIFLAIALLVAVSTLLKSSTGVGPAGS